MQVGSEKEGERPIAIPDKPLREREGQNLMNYEDPSPSLACTFEAPIQLCQPPPPR